MGKNSKKTSSKPTLSKEQFVNGSQKIVQLIGDESTLTFYVQVILGNPLSSLYVMISIGIL